MTAPLHDFSGTAGPAYVAEHDQARLSTQLDRIRDRFGPKVSPEPNTGCHLWTGAADTYGYGNFAVTPRKHTKASRVAWWLATGVWPEKLSVLHRCDNPPCVNFAHLFLGTQGDNMADASRKGRIFRHGPNRPRGERSHMTRLTAEQVREIRRRVAAGEEQKALASEYGVSTAGLNHIVARRTWGHIADGEP